MKLNLLRKTDTRFCVISLKNVGHMNHIKCTRYITQTAGIFYDAVSRPYSYANSPADRFGML